VFLITLVRNSCFLLFGLNHIIAKHLVHYQKLKFASNFVNFYKLTSHGHTCISPLVFVSAIVIIYQPIPYSCKKAFILRCFRLPVQLIFKEIFSLFLSLAYGNYIVVCEDIRYVSKSQKFIDRKL
jgi:hypothetical protein